MWQWCICPSQAAPLAQGGVLDGWRAGWARPNEWCGVVWCGVVWCGVVWCGVVWCGVVWCGVVWCGVVWCGVVWCGVVWCGVVWCGVVWCGVVWCGVVWCGVVWCGVVWCGVVWCGVVWCGVVWCGVVWCGVVQGCGAYRRALRCPPNNNKGISRILKAQLSMDSPETAASGWPSWSIVGSFVGQGRWCALPKKTVRVQKIRSHPRRIARGVDSGCSRSAGLGCGYGCSHSPSLGKTSTFFFTDGTHVCVVLRGHVHVMGQSGVAFWAEACQPSHTWRARVHATFVCFVCSCVLLRGTSPHWCASPMDGTALRDWRVSWLDGVPLQLDGEAAFRRPWAGGHTGRRSPLLMPAGSASEPAPAGPQPTDPAGDVAPGTSPSASAPQPL